MGCYNRVGRCCCYNRHQEKLRVPRLKFLQGETLQVGSTGANGVKGVIFCYSSKVMAFSRQVP